MGFWPFYDKVQTIKIQSEQKVKIGKWKVKLWICDNEYMRWIVHVKCCVVKSRFLQLYSNFSSCCERVKKLHRDSDLSAVCREVVKYFIPLLCERTALTTFISAVWQLYNKVKNMKSMKALLMSLRRVGWLRKEQMMTREGRGKWPIVKFFSRFYTKQARLSTWSSLLKLQNLTRW